MKCQYYEKCILSTPHTICDSVSNHIGNWEYCSLYQGRKEKAQREFKENEDYYLYNDIGQAIRMKDGNNNQKNIHGKKRRS